ncbi:MAG: lysylphosphatidylglycerol synthase domain-containing protein [Mycobacteriaceae bacterium]
MSNDGSRGSVAPADEEPGPAAGPRRHLRTVVGVVFLVVVVALAVVAVLRDRVKFAAALAEIGWGAVALSGLLAAGAVAASYAVWAQVLRSLSAEMPRRASVPVFFISQLGKYLPGSVWPVLAQMEAGRAHRIPRRSMVAANLLTLLVLLAVAVAVACALLPLGSTEALHRFWWLFLALPVLLVLAHPRVLPAVLDRAFRLVRQPPLDTPLRMGPLVGALGWSLLSWVLFGGHLAVLCAGLGYTGISVLVLCTGAMALAVTVGILFIPAPAGAGLREGALLLALSPLLVEEQGLVVALTSRVELVVVDLALAGLGAAFGAAVRLSRTAPVR